MNLAFRSFSRATTVMLTYLVAISTLLIYPTPAAGLGLDDIPRLKDAFDAYKDVRKFYDNYHWAERAIENANEGKPIPPIPSTDWAADKAEKKSWTISKQMRVVYGFLANLEYPICNTLLMGQTYQTRSGRPSRSISGTSIICNHVWRN